MSERDDAELPPDDMLPLLDEAEEAALMRAIALAYRPTELAAERRYGRMVCVSAGKVHDVPLDEAVSGQKFVDPDGELVRTARALGIGFGDEAP